MAKAGGKGPRPAWAPRSWEGEEELDIQPYDLARRVREHTGEDLIDLDAPEDGPTEPPPSEGSTGTTRRPGPETPASSAAPAVPAKRKTTPKAPAKPKATPKSAAAKPKAAASKPPAKPKAAASKPRATSKTAVDRKASTQKGSQKPKARPGARRSGAPPKPRGPQAAPAPKASGRGSSAEAVGDPPGGTTTSENWVTVLIQEQVVQHARAVGSQLVDGGKDLRRLEEEFRGKGFGTLAAVTAQLSEGLERFGRALAEGDPDDVAAKVKHALEDDPWRVVASGFSAGLLLARSLRTFGSSRRPAES